MKITKLAHACLVVEGDDGRVVLFDPGVMSEDAVRAYELDKLDDIVITHDHADHMSVELIKDIVDRFEDVRVLAPAGAAVEQLEAGGVIVSSEPSDGFVLFDAPHEDVEPLFETPDNIGVHYNGLLTHPGDSHRFAETMPVLALPVTAPWGRTTDAVKLAITLKPRYVVPIHDWFWSDGAKEMMYDGIGQVFEQAGIELLRLQDGITVDIDV